LRIVWILLATIMAIYTSNLFADQCAWNDSAVADKAVKLLKQKSSVVHWCELCSDDKPVKEKIKVVISNTVENGKYHEISINGKPVDLAYVFIPSAKKGYYNNLGKLSNCGASGVSREITYPSQKKSGKYKDWFGKFQHKNGLNSLTLKKPGFHGPNWLPLTFHLISNEWGDNRGELIGYLHMDNTVPTYVTPFAGCHLFFRLSGRYLNVSDNEQCGALAGSLAGEYTKQ